MANPIARRIYDRLPPTGQNVALALYGLNNRRRLRSWMPIITGASDSEHWDQAQQRQYVTSRLRELLAHAIRHVPRYAGLRPRLREIEDSRSDVIELLAAFSPVSRQEILADPDAFLSRAFDRRRLKETHTSGTTGSPFTTWMEPEVFLTNDALAWRRTLWAGYQRGDWIARLVGDPVIPLAVRNPDPPYRFSWTDRRLYFSAYHLDESTAHRIADCLLARRPAFLMGYPSALDALCRFCEGRTDLASWRPRAILYSSEPLYEHQRDTIRRVIDAPLRGWYGCAERVVSAAECEAGQYHLSLIDGFVDGQFGEAPAHQPARVTGLLNRAMPLIRYELGDTVVPLVGEECVCGRTLPLIDPVLTKLEDSLTTPSGREISGSILTWAFKDLNGLKKSQIVQDSRSSVEVRLQATPADFVRVQAVLESRLRDLVFDELEVSFRRVDELDVLASGKTRFVVNRLSRPGQRRAVSES
jgi:phenylacetate-CoA ligase